MCLGVILSIQAEVWLAHSVSPIWSGGIVSLIYVCLVSENSDTWTPIIFNVSFLVYYISLNKTLVEVVLIKGIFSIKCIFLLFSFLLPGLLEYSVPKERRLMW